MVEQQLTRRQKNYEQNQRHQLTNLDVLLNKMEGKEIAENEKIIFALRQYIRQIQVGISKRNKKDEAEKIEIDTLKKELKSVKSALDLAHELYGLTKKSIKVREEEIGIEAKLKRAEKKVVKKKKKDITTQQAAFSAADKEAALEAARKAQEQSK